MSRKYLLPFFAKYRPQRNQQIIQCTASRELHCGLVDRNVGKSKGSIASIESWSTTGDIDRGEMILRAAVLLDGNSLTALIEKLSTMRTQIALECVSDPTKDSLRHRVVTIDLSRGQHVNVNVVEDRDGHTDTEITIGDRFVTSQRVILSQRNAKLLKDALDVATECIAEAGTEAAE